MRQTTPIPAAAVERIPLPDPALTEENWRRALAGLGRCVVVLDDDPTGIQTVHGLYVYTDWSRETFVRGLTSGQPMFSIACLVDSSALQNSVLPALRSSKHLI